MSAVLTVPEHYVGAWQRKHLETEDEIDNSSHVYWLQSAVLHADIRIPADRPAFKDKKSLHDFSRDELTLLARQKGFAGKTLVAGNSCQWLRHIDYHPPRDRLDMGYMMFTGNRILETGTASNYAEIWERLPDSLGMHYAFRFEETNLERSPAQPQTGILVVTGDYFIFARDRVSALPTSATLDRILSEATPDQLNLYELMDFEISFGRVAKGNIPWEIQLSTLPFREGEPLFTESTWAAIVQAKNGCIQHEHAWNGVLSRRWIVEPSCSSNQQFCTTNLATP